MDTTCCVIAECANPSSTRGLCMPCYRRAYRLGTLEDVALPRNKGWHTVSNVDQDARTATCTVCGPTQVSIRMQGKGRSRVECMAVRRRNKGKYLYDKAQEREGRIARVYGITGSLFDEMLERQGGACATCQSPEPGGRGNWHIDHDHSCCPGNKSCGNCVRGLLCHGCNTALGSVKDDPETLRRMIDYLTTN